MVFQKIVCISAMPSELIQNHIAKPNCGKLSICFNHSTEPNTSFGASLTEQTKKLTSKKKPIDTNLNETTQTDFNSTLLDDGTML